MLGPRTRERTVLTVGTVAFAGFVAAVALVPEATGYRADLYSALSPLAWTGFAIAVTCGLLVIYSAVRTGSHRWLSGFGIVLGTYAAFYWLPVARGYVLYATPLADVLYHLGVVKDVLRYGGVPDVIYPATHLLIGLLVQFTGLSRTLFQPIVGYVFTVLLILGLFVSARALFRSHTGGLYALLAALPLVYTNYHIMISPWFYALCLFPVIFLLATQWLTGRNSRRAYVTLFIILLATTFYHPLISLLTAGILGIYAVYLRFVSLFGNWLGVEQSIETGSTPGALFFLPFIPIAVIVQWQFGLTTMQHRIVGIIIGFLQNEKSAASFVAQAGQTNYTLFELFWRFLVLQWGPTIIYLGVASLVLLVIGYRIWRRRAIEVEFRMAVLYIVSLGTVVVSLVFISTNNPVRAARFAVLIAIYMIATGLWYRHRMDRKHETPYSRVIAHCFLVVIVIVALLAAGITYRDDAQITESTIKGTVWHLEHQNDEILTKSHRMSRNLEMYYYGNQRARSLEPTFTRYNVTYQIPKHLGYDSNETIAAMFNGKRYLVTKYSDTQWYRDQPKDRYSELLFYNQSDLSVLAVDPAANRVYTNGNFSVWLADGGHSNSEVESLHL